MVSPALLKTGTSWSPPINTTLDSSTAVSMPARGLHSADAVRCQHTPGYAYALLSVTHCASVMPHLLPRDTIVGAGPDIVEKFSGDGVAATAKHPDLLADNHAFVAGPTSPRGMLEDLEFPRMFELGLIDVSKMRDILRDAKSVTKYCCWLYFMLPV